jgi:hypothetical protein
MADPRLKFMIEDAEIIPSFRNFTGRETRFNPPGIRNFCVNLDVETSIKMEEDGWNISYHKDENEVIDPNAPFIRIAVRFDKFPPNVVMITSRSRTRLSEDMVEILDTVDIRTADLIASGSVWNVNGKTGVKAYLRSLYVTVEEDELERKYAEEE